ncbi:MAG TPA: FecR domain-containing protein [Polyangiaceae bacterium]|jgi:hypothetical protein|nr:FecR domain-containing protein [Polyangiaceae bacterium]
MRFSRNDDGSERALSVVVDEARRQPAPELDWDTLETKLEHAIRQPSGAVNARRHSRFALALLPAAAVAAGLAAIFLPKAEPVAPPVAALAPLEAVKNGDSLTTEELIIAEDKPVEVKHAGRARWTLEPNGRALVLARGDVLRVRLIAGALRADVVPSPQPERFVVEAAGTRVAVHGTVFRVQLQGERTLVDVEQGVVSVGPRERPTQVTAMLRAPAHGEFTLEGGTVSTVGAPRVASQRLRVVRPVQAPGVASAEPATPDAAAPEASAIHSLTIGEVEAGVATAVDAINGCFKQHTEGSHNVHVSAETELTLDVSEAGVVTDVSFTPPLSPLVQSCAKREALSVHFAPSSEGARITRTLELNR